MAENLGSAVLQLSTDNTGLERGLEEGQRAASRAMGALRTAAVAGGLAAAGGIAAIGTAAFKVSADTQKATKRIQGQLRLTEKESQRLGKISQKVWADNFAGSIEEAGEAVMLLTQQMGDAARNQEQELVSLAFGIQDAYGEDIQEVIAEASTLVEEFGISGEQAMDFLAAGFQKGLDKSGDFLDSIGEYSNQFSDAGFSADEFFSLMETGMAGGVLGTDKISDAFKEFQIRILEAGDDATEALDNIGLSSAEVFAGISDGSVSVKDVFEDVLDALWEIEDPLERNRSLVALLGTQAEDLGIDFMHGINTGKTSMEEMEGAAKSLETQYNNLQSNIAAIGRTVVAEMSPLTDDLLTLANTVLPQINTWVQEHLPSLVSAIQKFRAAPLTTILSPTKEDYDAFIAETYGAGNLNAFVAKRRVLSLFGIPHDSENILLDALKSFWEGAKEAFGAWFTEADQAIRDFFYIPESETTVEGLKAWWPLVKTSFEGWLKDGQQIAELFFIPLAATVVEGLKIWWPQVREEFNAWITTAGEQIGDLVTVPTAADVVQLLKDMWQGSEGARQTFEGWLSTAGEFVSDLIDVPTAADVVQALKDWWGGTDGVRPTFEAWLVSANEQIKDLLYLPDAATAAAGIQTWWSATRAEFEKWLETSGEQITGLIELPTITTEDVQEKWGAIDTWIKGRSAEWIPTVPDLGAEGVGTKWLAISRFVLGVRGLWLPAIAATVVASEWGSIKTWIEERSGEWLTTINTEGVAAAWESVKNWISDRSREWLPMLNTPAAKTELDSAWKSVKDWIAGRSGEWVETIQTTDLQAKWSNAEQFIKDSAKLWFPETPEFAGVEIPDAPSREEVTRWSDWGTAIGAAAFNMGAIASVIFTGATGGVWSQLKTIFANPPPITEEDKQLLRDWSADVQEVLTSEDPFGTWFEQWKEDTKIAWDEWWNGLQTGITDWWTGVHESWGADWASFSLSIGLGLTLLDVAWKDGWDALKTTVATWWTNLKSEYEVENTGFRGGVDLGMALLGTIWENGWNALKEFVSEWWTNLKEEYGLESTDFQLGIDLALLLVKFAWENTWGAIADVVKGAWDDIKTYVAGIVNDIITSVNSVIGKINSAIGKWNAKEFSIGSFSRTIGGGEFMGLPVPSYTLAFGGFTVPTPDVPTLPTIPALAAGGIVNQPTLAMVGEAGPEAVIPLDSSRAGRFGGGNVINIENVYGFDDFREKVAEAGVDIQISGATNAFAGI